MRDARRRRRRGGPVGGERDDDAAVAYPRSAAAELPDPPGSGLAGGVAVGGSRTLAHTAAPTPTPLPPALTRPRSYRP